MKRIVVVDDRPWKVMCSIESLQKNGVIFYKTLYYPNNTLDKNNKQELMDKYKTLTHMDVVQVDTQKEFLDQMNELYHIPDIIFLMDYDLKGDMSIENFFTRVNVKYALLKNPENKIWFYTSGPSDIKGLLLNTFPDHIISTPNFYEGQLYWDNNQVKEIVELNENHEKGIQA